MVGLLLHELREHLRHLLPLAELLQILARLEQRVVHHLLDRRHLHALPIRLHRLLEVVLRRLRVAEQREHLAGDRIARMLLAEGRAFLDHRVELVCRVVTHRHAVFPIPGVKALRILREVGVELAERDLVVTEEDIAHRDAIRGVLDIPARGIVRDVARVVLDRLLVFPLHELRVPEQEAHLLLEGSLAHLVDHDPEERLRACIVPRLERHRAGHVADRPVVRAVGEILHVLQAEFLRALRLIHIRIGQDHREERRLTLRLRIREARQQAVINRDRLPALLPLIPAASDAEEQRRREVRQRLELLQKLLLLLLLLLEQAVRHLRLREQRRVAHRALEVRLHALVDIGDPVALEFHHLRPRPHCAVGRERLRVGFVPEEIVAELHRHIVQRHEILDQLRLALELAEQVHRLLRLLLLRIHLRQRHCARGLHRGLDLRADEPLQRPHREIEFAEFLVGHRLRHERLIAELRDVLDRLERAHRLVVILPRHARLRDAELHLDRLLSVGKLRQVFLERLDRLRVVLRVEVGRAERVVGALDLRLLVLRHRRDELLQSRRRRAPVPRVERLDRLIIEDRQIVRCASRRLRPSRGGHSHPRKHASQRAAQQGGRDMG